LYEEVTTPEAGLTKLFGEMEYLLEKATSEPDQKIVGFHSYLLCFFQFIADAFASCLRLKNHFNRNTGKSVLARSRFSPAARVLKSHRFHSTYVGIVQKTSRRPTSTILPTYKII